MNRIRNIGKLFFLIFGLLSISSCGKRSLEFPDSLVGEWVINEAKSAKISSLESESDTVDWERFQTAVAGKEITIKNSKFKSNMLFAKKQFDLKLMHRGLFYYYFIDEMGSPIAIKQISQNVIRVDWSVNMVEIYNRKE